MPAGIVRPRTPRFRRLVAGLTLLGLTATGTALTGAVTAAPASASTADKAQRFVEKINNARQEHGLRPLEVGPRITEVAKEQARRMANRDYLFHNPSLTSDIGNWSKIGENVGVGPGVKSIHHAFMTSPAHRDNILDPRYRRVGIGVVEVGGTLWVCEVFKDPAN